jgi:hypothetical protein
MDVCRFEVAPDCLEEGAGSRPPFLSGLERALSDEMAPCRPPAMAARTVRYAWPLVLASVGDGLRFFLNGLVLKFSTFVFILL